MYIYKMEQLYVMQVFHILVLVYLATNVFLLAGRYKNWPVAALTALMHLAQKRSLPFFTM